mmetsp:Transcript_24183/g.47557  ORF Transcript_24183/g.47557 Transcript_24183/m.47557 type:complete len:273 (+) Transcript_24183:1171-1989(+)
MGGGRAAEEVGEVSVAPSLLHLLDGLIVILLKSLENRPRRRRLCLVQSGRFPSHTRRLSGSDGPQLCRLSDFRSGGVGSFRLESQRLPLFGFLLQSPVGLPHLIPLLSCCVEESGLRQGVRLGGLTADVATRGILHLADRVVWVLGPRRAPPRLKGRLSLPQAWARGVVENPSVTCSEVVRSGFECGPCFSEDSAVPVGLLAEYFLSHLVDALSWRCGLAGGVLWGVENGGLEALLIPLPGETTGVVSQHCLRRFGGGKLSHFAYVNGLLIV